MRRFLILLWLALAAGALPLASCATIRAIQNVDK